MTATQNLLCVFLVGMSAFLSASEIALFSLSRFQLRELKDRMRPVHRKIKSLISDPGGLLVTILVANEIVNISIASLIADVVASRWEKGGYATTARLSRVLGVVPPWLQQTALALAFTAPVILFLCEITPKVIAARTNQILAPLVVEPLSWIHSGMKPLRSFLRWFLGLVGRRRNASHGKERKQRLLEEEFLLMVEEGNREGTIQDAELRLIKNVFRLDDRLASEICTPINRVLTLPVDATLRVALQKIRSKRHSRIPVMHPGGGCAGILYAKDLIRYQLGELEGTTTVEAVMRKPMVFSAQIRLSSLFRRLKDSKTHIAILEDVRGQPVGIVTMDDILETLLDDFLPEEESEEDAG